MARKTKKRTGGAIALPQWRPSAKHLWVTGAATLVGLAALNATVLQHGTHPAPLFQPRETVRPSAMAVRSGPIADANVRALQSRLKAMGYYTGELDGLMGNQTLTAVYEALDDPQERASEPTSTLTPEDREVRGADASYGADDLTALLNARSSSPTAKEPDAPLAAKTVERLQQSLADRGYDPGPVDGVMGQATRNALSEFQADEGLEKTGRADDATVLRLGLETRSRQG